MRSRMFPPILPRPMSPSSIVSPPSCRLPVRRPCPFSWRRYRASAYGCARTSAGEPDRHHEVAIGRVVLGLGGRAAGEHRGLGGGGVRELGERRVECPVALAPVAGVDSARDAPAL